MALTGPALNLVVGLAVILGTIFAVIFLFALMVLSLSCLAMWVHDRASKKEEPRQTVPEVFYR